MDKQIITFTANEQALSKTGGVDHYSSNKVSYVQAVFTLGDNWSGYDSISALWSSKYYHIATVLDAYGQCIVPTEVLKHKGKVIVNLAGTITTDSTVTERITSYPITALVVDADAEVYGSETADVTASQYEQYVAAVHNYAEDAADSADAAAESEDNAAESEQNAATSETNAASSESNALTYSTTATTYGLIAEGYAVGKQNGTDVSSGTYYENNAKYYAEAAAQSAAQSGYMYFYIDDNGNLILERTDNVVVTFTLSDGYLYVEAA